MLINGRSFYQGKTSFESAILKFNKIYLIKISGKKRTFKNTIFKKKLLTQLFIFIIRFQEKFKIEKYFMKSFISH